MSESNDLFQADVATVHGIDSLDLKATVGKLESLLGLFDIDVLMSLTFHLFDVLIVHHFQFKVLVGLDLLSLFSCQARFFNSSHNSFNSMADLHSSNLSSQEIRLAWQEIIYSDS